MKLYKLLERGGGFGDGDGVGGVFTRLVHKFKCTCSKALFPTERATARVHQVSKVSPSCRSLVQRKFHGFGNSRITQEERNIYCKTTTNVPGELGDGVGAGKGHNSNWILVQSVDKGLKEIIFMIKVISLYQLLLFFEGVGSVIYEL